MIGELRGDTTTATTTLTRLGVHHLQRRDQDSMKCRSKIPTHTGMMVSESTEKESGSGIGATHLEGVDREADRGRKWLRVFAKR